MGGFINSIEDALGQFGPASVVDILIISGIIYLVLLLMRGTTAVFLARGIVILLAMAFDPMTEYFMKKHTASPVHENRWSGVWLDNGGIS